MATNLRDRLTDLVVDADPGGPPADLWQRGRRRQRLHQIGTTIVVVAAVLVLGVGGVVWHDSRSGLHPAGTNGAPQVPDRIFAPSPWLPAFNGPPGPLVAVMSAPRKTLMSTSEGIVGITASSGQYGFLTLPRLTELSRDNAVALAPDGRHVAYWMSGQSLGSPNTEMVGATVVGVAVYDVATGRVQENPIRTQHGLDPSGLLWTDARTLVFAAGQTLARDGDSLRSHESSNAVPTSVWRVNSSGPTRLRVAGLADRNLFDLPGAAGRLVLGDQDLRARMVSLGHGVSGLSIGGFAVVAVSPGVRQVASMRVGGNPNAIRIAQLGASAGGRIEALGRGSVTRSSKYVGIVTWLDDEHLVAVRQNPLPRTLHAEPTAAIVEIDARSGRATTLIDPVPMTGYLGFAGDLLSSPVVHATAPPRPRGSRVELSMAIPILVVLVFGIVLWGRRVRRR
jgi:hypothetical protein